MREVAISDSGTRRSFELNLFKQSSTFKGIVHQKINIIP